MQKIKDIIYYNRNEIITVIICFILFFTFIFFNRKEDSIVINNIEKKEKEEKQEIDEETIMVDVKGEVNNPGTYEFEPGKRIIDAIEKSGGLTSKANVDSINLSEKITDEMVIFIPSKSDENTQSVFENKKKESSVVAKDTKISINTANISTLMTINGIGEKKAEAIVQYREQNGLFKSIEDITKVSGIGNSLFEKIKDYIKV